MKPFLFGEKAAAKEFVAVVLEQFEEAAESGLGGLPVAIGPRPGGEFFQPDGELVLDTRRTGIGNGTPLGGDRLGSSTSIMQLAGVEVPGFGVGRFALGHLFGHGQGIVGTAHGEIVP